MVVFLVGELTGDKEEGNDEMIKDRTATVTKLPVIARKGFACCNIEPMVSFESKLINIATTKAPSAPQITLTIVTIYEGNLPKV